MHEKRGFCRCNTKVRFLIFYKSKDSFSLQRNMSLYIKEEPLEELAQPGIAEGFLPFRPLQVTDKVEDLKNFFLLFEKPKKENLIVYVHGSDEAEVMVIRFDETEVSFNHFQIYLFWDFKIPCD